MQIVQKKQALLKVGIILALLMTLFFCFSGIAKAADSPKIVDFNIRTYNQYIEAKLMQPITDKAEWAKAEINQNIEVILTFDQAIKIADDAVAKKDLLLRIAGGTMLEDPNLSDRLTAIAKKPISNRTVSLKIASDNPKNLIITIGCNPEANQETEIKQTNAELTIGVNAETALDGNKNRGIVGKSGGIPVTFKHIKCIIPTGAELATVKSQVGTTTQPAYIIKKLSSRSNVRSMIYLQLLNNNEPLSGKTKNILSGDYIVHAHNFPSMIDIDPAKIEVDAEYESSWGNGYLKQIVDSCPQNVLQGKYTLERVESRQMVVLSQLIKLEQQKK